MIGRSRTDFSALTAAAISMRWFVVAGSPPLPVRGSDSLVIQPHPPGPGLPEQAPSVQTSRGTVGMTTVARGSAGSLIGQPLHSAEARADPPTPERCQDEGVDSGCVTLVIPASLRFFLPARKRA